MWRRVRRNADLPIRQGVRSLLASRDVAALSPEQSQALADLLAEHGYFGFGPVIRIMRGRAEQAVDEFLEAEDRRRSRHSPAWSARLAVRFVTLARVWLSMLLARDMVQGVTQEPRQEELNFISGWAIAPIDVERLSERLLDEE